MDARLYSCMHMLVCMGLGVYVYTLDKWQCCILSNLNAKLILSNVNELSDPYASDTLTKVKVSIHLIFFV